MKKKIIIFQKDKGNTFTLLIIFTVKSVQKEQKSTNLLLWPLICRKKNLQSLQSESTPRRLTLVKVFTYGILMDEFDSLFFLPKLEIRCHNLACKYPWNCLYSWILLQGHVWPQPIHKVKFPIFHSTRNHPGSILKFVL